MTKAATGVVLQKKMFLKFHKYHKRTPVLESLFYKVAGLGLQLYLKETPTWAFSCEIYEIFKNTYFEEHLKRLLT